MNSQIFINDIKKLLIHNKLLIAIVTVIVTIMVAFASTSFSFFSTNSDEEPLVVEGESNNPGIFRIYVEQQDGTIYINSMIIEEYFLLPEVIAEAERVTGVEISDILDEEVADNFEKTQYDRGALGISRNGSTHIFTFTTNIGTEAENLKVADFYFDYLNSGDLKILDNKRVYIVSEPEVFDAKSYAASDIVVEQSPMNNRTDFSIKVIALSVVAGIILGFFTGTFIALAKSFMSKKISYSFNYAVSDYDKILAMEKGNWDLLVRKVIHTTKNPVVIFSEGDSSELREELIKHSNINVISDESQLVSGMTNVVIANKLSDISPQIPLDNVVVIIDTFNTEKKWYKTIFKTIHAVVSEIAVIQIS